MATEAKQDTHVEADMAEKKEPAGIEIDAGAAKKARRSAESLGASLMEKLAAQIGAQAGAQAVYRRAHRPQRPHGRAGRPVDVGYGRGLRRERGGRQRLGGGGGAITRPVGYIDITDDGATYVPLSKPWQDWRLVLTWAVAIWLALEAPKPDPARLVPAAAMGGQPRLRKPRTRALLRCARPRGPPRRRPRAPWPASVRLSGQPSSTEPTTRPVASRTRRRDPDRPREALAVADDVAVARRPCQRGHGAPPSIAPEAAATGRAARRGCGAARRARGTRGCPCRSPRRTARSTPGATPRCSGSGGTTRPP